MDVAARKENRVVLSVGVRTCIVRAGIILKLGTASIPCLCEPEDVEMLPPLCRCMHDKMKRRPWASHWNKYRDTELQLSCFIKMLFLSRHDIGLYFLEKYFLSPTVFPKMKCLLFGASSYFSTLGCNAPGRL